ncbi:MAG TPA: hypothetical protein PLD88_07270, partial [Candidatus Berkiella sp.]|nr:hypothetical protein [Candidatus Berkiella sp.]
ITIPYQEQFDYMQADSSGLYYGVSVMAWRHLLEKQGYQFVTVDSNGVNAFFIQPACFASEFIAALKPKYFAENFYQRQKCKGDWKTQFAHIASKNFKEVA